MGALKQPPIRSSVPRWTHTKLHVLVQNVTAPCCDPYRRTSRTFENEAIEKLIEASVSKEATALAEFIEARKDRDADMERTPASQSGTGMSLSNLECSGNQW